VISARREAIRRRINFDLLPTVETLILTERQIDVLRQVAMGYSDPEVAQRLGISYQTVRTHMVNIYGRLGLENRTQAAIYAVHIGLVDRREVQAALREHMEKARPWFKGDVVIKEGAS
jgi:DNA-binding NarL/FixJ family response regulator